MTNNQDPDEPIVVATQSHRKSRRRRTAVITTGHYSAETVGGKICSVEIDSLGIRLRQERVAAGRTIASVAAEAGLSVPYIANLENGRGNPTWSAVNRLAAALGMGLAVERNPGNAKASQTLPDSLTQFANSPRFSAETNRVAHATKTTEPDTRRRLLHAMTTMGALVGEPLSELDWHRILDTVVLITRT